MAPRRTTLTSRLGAAFGCRSRSGARAALDRAPRCRRPRARRRRSVCDARRSDSTQATPGAAGRGRSHARARAHVETRAATFVASVRRGVDANALSRAGEPVRRRRRTSDADRRLRAMREEARAARGAPTPRGLAAAATTRLRRADSPALGRFSVPSRRGEPGVLRRSLHSSPAARECSPAWRASPLSGCALDLRLLGTAASPRGLLRASGASDTAA